MKTAIRFYPKAGAQKYVGMLRAAQLIDLHMFALSSFVRIINTLYIINKYASNAAIDYFESPFHTKHIQHHSSPAWMDVCNAARSRAVENNTPRRRA